MSKSATQDIFSQTQVNIAQSCSRVLNAWNDFLDKYLKAKKWKRKLAVINKVFIKNVTSHTYSNGLCYFVLDSKTKYKKRTIWLVCDCKTRKIIIQWNPGPSNGAMPVDLCPEYKRTSIKWWKVYGGAVRRVCKVRPLKSRMSKYSEISKLP